MPIGRRLLPATQAPALAPGVDGALVQTLADDLVETAVAHCTTQKECIPAKRAPISYLAFGGANVITHA